MDQQSNKELLKDEFMLSYASASLASWKNLPQDRCQKS